MVAIAVVLGFFLVLNLVNLVISELTKPTIHGCAVAAEQVMVQGPYSIVAMQTVVPRPDACRGLSAVDYSTALWQAYRMEPGFPQ